MKIKRAVFLDRDGVINEARGFIINVKDVRIFKEVPDAIKKLNKRFYVIIITNQPQVGRGLCTERRVKKINSYIVKELRKKGAKINAVFYCPHHPEQHSDIPAFAKKYRIKCECRKPNIGMIIKAKKRFGLDIKKSYFVGDTTIDVKTGKNCGCKTVLLRTGYAGKDRKYKVKPDFISKNMKTASETIISDSE